MTLSFRAALLVSATLSIVGSEGVSLARTSAPSLSELAGVAVQGPSRGVGGVTAPSDDAGAEARRQGSQVCHISRHPRDGVPASIHACPLVLASTDDSPAAAGLN